MEIRGPFLLGFQLFAPFTGFYSFSAVMIAALGNALLALIWVAGFGYVNAVQGEGAGTVASVALAAFLIVKRRGAQAVLQPLLVLGQIYVLNPYGIVGDYALQLPTGVKSSTVAYCLFLIQVSQLFFTKSRNLDGSSHHDEAAVQLRPYEREIRAILMTYDHGKLHTVDTLLQQNKGYESLLLQRLKEEYDITTNDFEYQGSPLPSPKPRGRSQSRSRSPPGPAAAGGIGSVGDGGGAGAADWNTSADLFQAEIRKFVNTHEPQLLRHLPAMFSDYVGREEELLKLLYAEFDLQYVQPPHMRKYGTNVAPVAHNPNPNSSPFASRGQTILDMARQEARDEIEKNLRKRTMR